MTKQAPTGYEWVKIPTFKDWMGEQQYIETYVLPEHRHIYVCEKLESLGGAKWIRPQILKAREEK